MDLRMPMTSQSSSMSMKPVWRRGRCWGCPPPPPLLVVVVMVSADMLVALVVTFEPRVRCSRVMGPGPAPRVDA